MTRGRDRWGSKDLRQFFPLPSERHDEPRFDGEYRASDGTGVIRFEPDGTLTWDGRKGKWHMHGSALHVVAAERDGEGAIDGEAVYLLSASGSGREDRRQSVLAFTRPASGLPR